jgi:hypothetical protein
VSITAAALAAMIVQRFAGLRRGRRNGSGASSATGGTPRCPVAALAKPCGADVSLVGGAAR